MKIHAFQLGQIGTNAYLVLPDNTDEAILVDCPLEASDEIPIFLEKVGRKLSAILLTHGHWDHVWDTCSLASKTGAKVYASKFGTSLIENADFQREVLFADYDLKSAKIDVKISDGDVFEITGLKIKCSEVFGHSPDSIAYYIESEGVIFVGDALFDGSIGRTDLWKGDFPTLEKSIKEKLYCLPDETVVLCGHGNSTTIAKEKASNPFVRG